VPCKYTAQLRHGVRVNTGVGPLHVDAVDHAAVKHGDLHETRRILRSHEVITTWGRFALLVRVSA